MDKCTNCGSNQFTIKIANNYHGILNDGIISIDFNDVSVNNGSNTHYIYCSNCGLEVYINNVKLIWSVNNG